MRHWNLSHARWAIACSLCYSAVDLCAGLLVGSIGPAIEVLANTLQRDVSDFSVVFIGRGVGYLIGTVLTARVLAKFPHYGNFISCGVLVGIALSHGALPLLTTLPAIVASYCLSGFFIGVADTTHNTLLTFIHQDNALGPWMQVCHRRLIRPRRGQGAASGRATRGGGGHWHCVLPHSAHAVTAPRPRSPPCHHKHTHLLLTLHRLCLEPVGAIGRRDADWFPFWCCGCGIVFPSVHS